MNNDLEIIWKEAVVAEFHLLFWNCHAGIRIIMIIMDIQK
jgi:hypothetical protein